MFSIHKEEYQPVEQDDLVDKNDDVRQLQYRAFRSNRYFSSFLVILVISLISNGIQFYSKLLSQAETVCKSEYAQLSPEISQVFLDPDHTNSIPDEEWDSIPLSPGIVALTGEYAATKDFPLTQPYPWDTNKGIYFLQGHHNLHCVKMIRQSIFEYRHHRLQTQHYMHIDHCLLVLRDDVICNADDTPRIANPFTNQSGSGIGQYRLCKDWRKLDAWAEEHTACYQDRTSRDQPMLELFMNCPDGSKPWEGLL